MTKSASILHVEDSTDDAELLRLTLAKAEVCFDIKRVDAEPAYQAALAAAVPDVILCDYDMREFSAERALAIVREMGLEVPFIVVSDHIGETAALVAMQHGADDYLSKGDLGRLPKAIALAMERARYRTELQASRAMKRAILDSLDSRIAVLDCRGVIKAVNRAWVEAGQANTDVGQDYFAALHGAAARGDEFAEEGAESIRAVIARRRPFATLDYRVGRGAAVRWHLARITPLEGSDHGAVVSHMDITERMMAHAALESAHRRLQVLSKRVLGIQEEERRVISRELHDDVGQNLAALKIGLHRLALTPECADSPLLAECLTTADATLEQLRTIARELRPPQLDQLGLVDALGWLADRQGRASGIDISCVFEGLDERRPPAALEGACYRIAQEAINNATRHGRPGKVTVRVDREAAQLRLSVRDDGIGFDVEGQRLRALKSGSLGLISMEERAELAGGRLELSSCIGGGTNVSALFPLESAAPA
jgi:two-component system sensor histidine kinase UhpB